MSARRGGIPGPESRTGLVRPAMTEAEFERRQGLANGRVVGISEVDEADDAEVETAPSRGNGAGASASRNRPVRGKATKPRRVQRMFAIEEDLDRKLWLYAIHMGKDRSEVVNDLLRPVVASMVLYDSRDRRSSNAVSRGVAETEPAEGQGAETAASN